MNKATVIALSSLLISSSAALAGPFSVNAKGIEQGIHRSSSIDAGSDRDDVQGTKPQEQMSGDAEEPREWDIAVYGKDDRFKMPRGKPWDTIGKVVQGTEFCTGTLVAPCLVLTASHCITENKSTDFYSSNNGPHAHVVRTYYIDRDPQKSWGTDWEILVLNKRLGDQRGWMGVKDWSGPDYRKYSTFTLAGYSSDLMNGGSKATVDNRVSIYKTFANNVIYHDGNGSFGASGAPIFAKYDDGYYVVAIHTRSYNTHYSYYAESVASIGVAGHAFLSTVEEAAQKWCPYPAN